MLVCLYSIAHGMCLPSLDIPYLEALLGEGRGN